MPPSDIDLDAARACAKSLFMNGSGEKADRLVLWRDSTDHVAFLSQKNLGSWGIGPLADRIAAALSAAREQGARDEREACAVYFDEMAKAEEEYQARAEKNFGDQDERFLRSVPRLAGLRRHAAAIRARGAP